MVAYPDHFASWRPCRGKVVSANCINRNVERATSKDIARYSILHDSDNLFAAKYMPLMPTEEELRREIEQQKELYRLQQENK